MSRDATLSGRKSTLRLELERSRSRIINVRREMKAFDERLATLPNLEETQKRFQEAGLEERLKEKSLLIREGSSLNFPVKSPYGSPRSVKLLIPPTCLAGEARCEAPRLS